MQHGLQGLSGTEFEYELKDAHSEKMWKFKSHPIKSNTTPNVEKVKGKSWPLQLTYIYPQPLIMRETD